MLPKHALCQTEPHPDLKLVRMTGLEPVVMLPCKGSAVAAGPHSRYSRYGFAVISGLVLTEQPTPSVQVTCSLLHGPIFLRMTATHPTQAYLIGYGQVFVSLCNIVFIAVRILPDRDTYPNHRYKYLID